MEMFDIIDELVASRTALEKAKQEITSMKIKRTKDRLVILGLVFFGYSVCKMLNKCEAERKAEKKRADEAETACAVKDAQLLETQCKNACDDCEACSSEKV